MLPIPNAHIQFPPGLVVNLAHLRHTLLGFFGRNKPFAALILKPELR